MGKKIVLSMLLVVTLFSIPACSPGVPQQEYDRVSNELSAVQDQLAELQDKLAEAESQQGEYEELSKRYVALKSEHETAQTEYEELNDQYEELNKQIGPIKSELEAMQSDYEELSKQHEELSEKYAIATKEPDEIGERELEQAIFELINQARSDIGADELIWGENIYKWAMENSRSMAASKRREYSSYASWQEIYWAAGHSTVDRMASAVFTIWKDGLQYEQNILNKVATYGTVGVHRAGDIYYITYIASHYR